jgi:hypothetical protein
MLIDSSSIGIILLRKQNLFKGTEKYRFIAYYVVIYFI